MSFRDVERLDRFFRAAVLFLDPFLSVTFDQRFDCVPIAWFFFFFFFTGSTVDRERWPASTRRHSSGILKCKSLSMRKSSISIHPTHWFSKATEKYRPIDKQMAHHLSTISDETVFFQFFKLCLERNEFFFQQKIKLKFQKLCDAINETQLISFTVATVTSTRRGCG